MATKTKAKTTDTLADQARHLGDELKHGSRNLYLAGLGVVSAVDEETRGWFDRMISRGESFESSDRNVMKKALDDAGERLRGFGRSAGEKVESTFGSFLHRSGVPSRDEIRELTQRVEQLTRRVEEMSHQN